MSGDLDMQSLMKLVASVAEYKKDRSKKVLCPSCNSGVTIQISSYNNHAAVQCNNESCGMGYIE